MTTILADASYLQAQPIAILLYSGFSRPGMEEHAMTATDPALTALAQGWCALSLLHGRIEAHIERALQAGHD
ncbi:hypothetical protein ACM01_46020, partial [Streptomyces viridochromogenes]